MDYWENIKKLLEPAALHFYTTPYTDINLSIAISLKRIADKLELSQKQPIIMTADEALKFYAAKDGC